MGEEIENREAPNWLRELEAKREQRLKARLGHEAGAGAPCLTCEEKCPGLDLHFWRKICKNCKCAKENHDVHDDDIYGWAQFQLLGSKPNKSRKFKLPGKKEEIILEWTPKGHNETVDKYLKTLPPELLPVRGSAAAQERKQLLQKQIPIHDIDPTLCHELTEAELNQMNEYVAHIKQNSVGIGHVVQLGLNRGSKHTIGRTDPQILASRYPAQLSNTQAVQLQASNNASLLKNGGKLGEKFAGLSLEEQRALNVPEEVVIGAKPGQIYDVNYPTYERVKTPDMYYNYEQEREKVAADYATNVSCKPNEVKNLLPNYQPNVVETIRTPTKPGVVRNISPARTEKVVGLNPRTLPHYAPGTIKQYDETKTPQKIANIRDLAFSTYDPQKTALENEFEPPNYNKMADYDARAPPGGPRKNLLLPNQLNLAENLQKLSLVNIGAINDIVYPTMEVQLAEKRQNELFEPSFPDYHPSDPKETQKRLCHRCRKPFEDNAIAIGIERSSALFHSGCFKCKGCNQNLADLVYFYDRDSDDIYCGRDYAKIRGIPRCKACDELIFVKEYCLAENSTFHVKHFCCFECDMPLAGQNYVMEDAQPLCLPCYDKVKASRCASCGNVIKPDETGAMLNGLHFHVNDGCFACKVCGKPLLDCKLLLKNGRLYCSAVCYGADK